MNPRLITSLCLLHLSLVLACQRSDSSLHQSPEWLSSEVERLNATDQGERALSLLYEMAEGTRESLGDSSSEYAAVLFKIGQQYTFLRDYTKADSVFVVSEKLLSHYPSRAWLLSDVYHSHGQSLILSGDHAKAETIFREALRFEMSRVASDTATLARPLLDLSTLYFIKFDYPNAIPYLERWREIHGAVNLPLDSAYFEACGQLTASYSAVGENRKLVKLADEILNVLDSTNQDYPSVRLSVNTFAGVAYQQLGEISSAKSAYSRALQKANELGDTTSAMYRVLIWKYGVTLAATGSVQDAAEYFESSLQLTESIDGTDSDGFRDRAKMMADFYRKVGNVERAIELDSVVKSVSGL